MNWRRIKWLIIAILAITYVVVVGSWWVEGNRNLGYNSAYGNNTK